MSHIIKEPVGLSFDRVGIQGKVFPTTNLTSKTRFVLISTQTKHETTIIEHECDFIYYILEGSGEFIIENEVETCKIGDLVVIPAGTKFTYQGNLRMLLNTTPPYTPEQEEIIK